MPIIAGQQAVASDFVATSAGVGDSSKVPKLNGDGQLDQSFFKAPVVRVYDTAAVAVGDSTTQFDITIPVAGTVRYTWDGTGTNPNLSLANNPVGSLIAFQAQNFNAANNGVFVVTGAGANFVEVTNVSGVAEVNKTIGTGYVATAPSSMVWTKPTGLSHVVVELVSGGGKGGNVSTGGSTATVGAGGGGGGGYSRELIPASSLPSSVGCEVCPGGTSAINPASRRSSFGSFLYATGAENGGGEGGPGGAGGLGVGGNVNAAGNGGGQGADEITTSPRQSDIGGFGGGSFFGGGAPAPGAGNNDGIAGRDYGGGGSGATASSASTSRTGGNGARGVVIVTEFYS